MNKSLNCPQCGTGGSIEKGIPSFIPLDDGPNQGWLTPAELERFANQVETGSIRNATFRLFDGHEHRAELLSEVYNIERDSWRVLVADHLEGRCLDLQAGFGRRSHLLAELVNKVYAVDPTLDKLRVLSARNDYDGENIQPVHATTDRLPFPKGAFDTVVADLTEQNGLRFRDQIENLGQYVAEDGTIVLIMDGLVNRIDLMKWLWFGDQSTQSNGVFPLSPRGPQKVLHSLGFEIVEGYALLPTVRDLSWIFDIDDRNAIRTLVGKSFSGDGLHKKLGRVAKRSRVCLW